MAATITAANPTSRGVITLSEDQEAAAEKIRGWLNGDQWELSFSGAAGTGKSTVLGYLYDELRAANTLFMAPSAKAAYVLQLKGIPACTIHSAIFLFAGSYVNHRDNEVPIFNERDGIKCDAFEPQRFIVDESSMIDMNVATEIRSKERPVCWVGDRNQIPAIGEDAHLLDKPDISLEQIHRQAADSPILNLAHDIKNGASPSMRHRASGAVDVVGMKHPKLVADYAIKHGYEQIVCGFNATRHQANVAMREALGLKGMLSVGDKLICRFNNRRAGVINGMMLRVEKIHSEDEKAFTCDLRVDLGGGVLGTPRKSLRVQKQSLGNPNYKTSERESGCVDMDYGYCITCHAGQGSGWPSVLVIWQPSKQWSMSRWGYTAVTRAESRVGVCL